MFTGEYLGDLTIVGYEASGVLIAAIRTRARKQRTESCAASVDRMAQTVPGELIRVNVYSHDMMPMYFNLWGDELTARRIEWTNPPDLVSFSSGVPRIITMRRPFRDL